MRLLGRPRGQPLGGAGDSAPSWPGGPPRAAAPFAWRAVLTSCRAVAAALGLRLVVEGRENLPAGPSLIAAAPHRTWLDPFALLFALPIEPRVYFLGDGEAIYRDAVRTFFVRRLGGVVPIWRGSRGIEMHVEAARQLLSAGARFALFPERGPAVPLEQARPLAAGIGYLALRTGAPIVPAVIGGTYELYLGRRVAVRFLHPLEAQRAPGSIGAPPLGSREERVAAHELVDRLALTMAPHVTELFRATEPPARFNKRWRWLTTAFH